MSSEDETVNGIDKKKRKRISVLSDEDSIEDGECSGNRSDLEEEILVKRKRIGQLQVLSSDQEDGSDVAHSSDGEESDDDSGTSESADSEESEGSCDEEGDEAEFVDNVENVIDSDESDGQSDKCPICLNKFKGQETGTPESCDHTFCLDCIQEWARNMNTCPVDRQVFNLILVKEEISEKIIRRIPVAGKADDLEDAVENDMTFCEVCGRGDREDRLLLCDACDLGYHCECLDPTLVEIPVEEWYCPDCSPNHDPDNVEVVDEVREMVHNGFRPRPLDDHPRRAIARTRASENVRNRIERRRLNQGLLAINNLTDEADAQPRPTATPRRRVTMRRRYRRRTRRRKVSKKTSASTSKSKSSVGSSNVTKYKRRRKTRRRKRKRTVRSRRAARPLISTDSAKKRIAEKLGLRRPPPGRTIPLVQSKSSHQRPIFGARADSGPSLSLFGDREELIEFEDSYLSDECGAAFHGEVGVLASRRVSFPHRAMKKAVSILNQCKSDKRVPLVIPTASTSSASFDILGSILQNQSILHSSSQNIVIGRDGTLVHSDRSPSLSLTQTTPVKKQPINPASPSSPPGSPNGNERMAPQSSSNSSSNTSSSRVITNQSAAATSEETRAGWETGQHNLDGNGPPESPCAFDPRRKATKNNKESKPSQSDDDIDIYSDIETISNEGEEDVFPQVNNTDDSVKCNSTSSAQSEICPTSGNVGNLNVSDSSDDELVIDEEAAQEHELAQKASAIDLESISGPDSPDMDDEPYSSSRRNVESVASLNSSQEEYPGSIDVESIDTTDGKINDVYNPESPTTDDAPNMGTESQDEKIKSNSQEDEYDPEISVADDVSDVDESDPNVPEYKETSGTVSNAPYDPERSMTGDDVSQEKEYFSEAPTSDDQESMAHEDDVISAKVGSPISDSEEVTLRNRNTMINNQCDNKSGIKICPSDQVHEHNLDNVSDKDFDQIVDPTNNDDLEQENDENLDVEEENYACDVDKDDQKDADQENVHDDLQNGQFDQESDQNIESKTNNLQPENDDLTNMDQESDQDVEMENEQDDVENDYDEPESDLEAADKAVYAENEQDQLTEPTNDQDLEKNISDPQELSQDYQEQSENQYFDQSKHENASNEEALLSHEDLSSRENSNLEEKQPLVKDVEIESNLPKLISDGVEDISDVGSDDNQLDYGDDDEDNENNDNNDKAQEGEPADMDDDDEEDAQEKIVDEDDDILPPEIEEIADDIKLEKSDIEDFEDEKVGDADKINLEQNSSKNTELSFVPVVIQKHVHKDSCSKSRSSRNSNKINFYTSKSSDKKNDKDAADINWKKPSKSNKERSYRDGKYRDEKVIFGERELKDKDDEKKRESRRKDDSRKGSDHSRKSEKHDEFERKREDSDRRTKDDRQEAHERRRDSHHDRKKDDRRSTRSEKYKSADRRDHSKERRSEKEHHHSTDKEHEKEQSDRRYKEKTKSREHHEKSRSRLDKEKLTDSSNVKRSDKEKNRESNSKHTSKVKRKDFKSPDPFYKYDDGNSPEKYFAYDEEFDYLYDDPHLEPCEKRKDRDVRKVDDKIIVEKHEKPMKKDKSDRKQREEICSAVTLDSKTKAVSSSPSPEISDIESKEIFSKDGSIIINVNYNRNKDIQPKDKNLALVAKDTEKKDKGKTTSRNEQEHKKIKTVPQTSWNNSDDELVEPKENWSDRVERQKPHSPLSPPPEDEDSELEKNNVVFVVPDEKLVDKPKPPRISRKKLSPSRGRNKDSGNVLPKMRQKPRRHPEVITISESDEESAQVREASSPMGDGSNNSGSGSGESHDDRKTYRRKKSNHQSEGTSAHSSQDQDGRNKESLNFSGMFKRQPRSPSPPSPMDNESYDPCEPTRSPSFKGSEGHNSPNHSQSPSRDPKPPPEPELPPLPPEPEPQAPAQPPKSSNIILNQPVASSPSVIIPQSVAMQTLLPPSLSFSATQPSQFQNSVPTGIVTSIANMHLPPPNFMTQTLSRNLSGGPVPLVTAGIQGLQGLRWSLGGAPPTMLFPAGASQINQMQHVMHSNFISHQISHQRLPHPGAQMSGMMPPNGNSIAAAMLHPMRQQMPGPPLLPTPTMPPHGNPGSMNSLPLGHRQMNMPDITQPPPNMLQPHHQQQLRMNLESGNHMHNSMQHGRSSPLLKTYTSLPMIVSSMPLVTTVPVTVISQQSLASGNIMNAPHGTAIKVEGMGVVDMEVDSPYSPPDSPGLADPMDENISPDDYKNSAKNSVAAKVFQSGPPKDAFDALLAAVPKLLEDKATRDLLVAGAAKVSKLSAANASKNKNSSDKNMKGSRKHNASGQSGASGIKPKSDSNERTSKHKKKHHGKKGVAVKRNETQLKIIDDLPSSAVEMQVKEKYMKKLNRQERVVEEVKLSLKPFYNKKDISKEDYKAILRKCVPKVCHNKTGEINPVKIKAMVDTYVKKYRHMRKKGQKTFES